MGEFNGRKFYGFSLHNDPALSTTTRNFEFRYMRPEALERAIQKVQLTDGTTKDKDKQKKNALLNKYCKPKGLRRSDGVPVKSRDIDVETQLSRSEVNPSSETNCPVRPIAVRQLSENEIEKLIGKAKSTMEMVGDQSRGSGEVKHMRSATTETEDEADVQAPSMSEQTTQTLENALMEIFCLPQPQWVEIEENSYASDVLVDEVKEQLLQDSSGMGGGGAGMSSDFMAANLFHNFPQMMHSQHQQLQPQQQQRQFLKQSKSQPVRGSLYYEKNTSNSSNPNCCYVEDSDYEYEMLRRSDYTKFCEPRPGVENITNVSNEDGGIAEFIEMEPRIPCMDLSFLKNAAPIRYTELTDDIHEEEARIEASHMKVFIKNLKTPNPNETVNETKHVEKKITEKNPLPKEITSVSQHKVFNPSHASSKKQNKKEKPVPPTPIEIPLLGNVSSRKYVQSPRSPRSSKNTPRKATNTPRTPKDPISRDSQAVPSRMRVRNAMSKSIEELKIEKIGIFTKMTTTQERIVELLDKLRLNLLEIYIPDNDFDKSKRQKNAFEFSVRFSRNFLYPLKGMIDDVRSMSKEHFNSSASNDACLRVSSIYALIQQALTTYQKQLRLFLLDQVPQKLTTLIDLINSLTLDCLDKRIFDRHDAIIECLLDRCSKFTGFLEDLHEERFLTARDNYCKTNLEKKPTPSVHTKYDLKMFMNDLNMYEPKLVPKNSRHPLYKLYQKQAPAIGQQIPAGTSENSSPRKLRRKVKKRIEEPEPFDDLSSNIGIKGAEVCVPTQIQGVDESSELLSSVQNLLSSSNDRLTSEKAKTQEVANTLNKAVIEALQLVTKEQVRRVLEPIIQTLGTALDKKNNSETIEAILKALNKKSFSTKQNENIKRHDTEKIHRRSKVTSNKVTTENSTSSIQISTNALKASEQTKNRSTSKKRESSKTATAAAADDSAAGTSAAAGAHGGFEFDRTTASETESEVDNSLREIESGNDGNCGRNKFDVHISKKKRMEALELQEQRLLRRREQMLRHEQFQKHLQYQQQQYHKHQQQQQQHFEQQIQNQLEEQEAHEQEHQPHRSQHANNQTSTGKKGAASNEDHQQQQQQQQEDQQPQKQRQKQRQQQVTTPNATSTVNSSSASTTTQRETSKPRPAVIPCSRYKTRLHKKKRNPLLPPPPAPTATPLTSARTPRSARSTRSAARFSYMARQTAGSVEELPHTARSTQQRRRVTHTGRDVSGNNDSNNNNNNNNNSKMTSQHRDASEALEALTAAINKQQSSDTETVAAATAIAAALGSANFNENDEAFTLLQSSVIVDVLANCIANVKMNDNITDEEDEDHDDVEQMRNKRVTNASADVNNGEVEDRSSYGAGGDHHFNMYTNNSIFTNQQKIHLEQLQIHQQQQFKIQRNQLVQQIRELQKIPIGQPANQQIAGQQDSESKQQQQRQELLGKLAAIEQQFERPPSARTPQPSPRRPLNEINQYQQNYGSSYNNFDNDKENHLNINSQTTRRHKSRPAKLDLKIDSLLHERDQFLGLCSKNRFYSNPNYSEPWKVFSRISDKLATEIVNSVEEDFTIGVSKFVQDFLELETQT